MWIGKRINFFLFPFHITHFTFPSALDRRLFLDYIWVGWRLWKSKTRYINKKGEALIPKPVFGRLGWWWASSVTGTNSSLPWASVWDSAQRPVQRVRCLESKKPHFWGFFVGIVSSWPAFVPTRRRGLRRAGLNLSSLVKWGQYSNIWHLFARLDKKSGRWYTRLLNQKIQRSSLN